MKKLTYTLMATTMFMAIGTAAQAETVTTETYTEPTRPSNSIQVDFKVFDLNNDGIYSMQEVGERLFESFDTNNDDLIDNTEYNKNIVMTITPMEQETYQFIDNDDDGYVEKSTYTYETFYQTSGLARFDDNADGLSAHDFVDKSLQELDKDDDNLISLKEWKQAYTASVKPSAVTTDYNG